MLPRGPHDQHIDDDAAQQAAGTAQREQQGVAHGAATRRRALLIRLSGANRAKKPTQQIPVEDVARQFFEELIDRLG